MSTKQYVKNQAIALSLTIITFIIMVGLLWVEILLINLWSSERIVLHLRISDILVGVTIYLKTSIDFAIFIGRLMEKNTGLKGRIGIEIGTALGNAVGTFLILLLWAVFKEISWLLAIMIIIAALVLVRLAQDGLEHIDTKNNRYPAFFRHSVSVLDSLLKKINKPAQPILSKLLPSHTLRVTKKVTLGGLLALSFAVPFVLGLDDFAGYVPLFNIVNVFGFAIGVFAGHMILNIFLYISPKRTVALVKNPLISFLGSVAFIVLAFWGLYEAFILLFLHR